PIQPTYPSSGQPPAPGTSIVNPIGVPLGELVSTTCDTRCVACAEGEFVICRYFTVTAPHGGVLTVKIDANTRYPVAVTGGVASVSGPVAGRWYQPAASAACRFRVAGEDPNGTQVPLRVLAALD